MLYQDRLSQPSEGTHIDLSNELKMSPIDGDQRQAFHLCGGSDKRVVQMRVQEWMLLQKFGVD
jgi:hypothetical protein